MAIGVMSVIAGLMRRKRGGRLCWRRVAPAPLPATFGVTAAHVAAAARRISTFVHRTPVQTSASMDMLSRGRRVFFKCELLQRTGSFKIRGATNAALLASSKTLVTHSSGNHAQALALAARSAGGKAHIVMPRTAPAVKRAAVAAYGGEIELCEPTNEARAAAAADLRERVSGHLVHPSNDLDVIAGQGTVAAELLSDVPNLDVIIVPVGGGTSCACAVQTPRCIGGLISGITVYAKSFNPRIKVIGAEPAAVDDAARSKAADRLIDTHDNPAPETIADGLKTVLGSNTWPVVRDLVDSIITVDETAIAVATKLVWTRMKLCIEPSAGVGVAVLLSDKFFAEFPPHAYPQVGVVLCGGNVDLVNHKATALVRTYCVQSRRIKQQEPSCSRTFKINWSPRALE